MSAATFLGNLKTKIESIDANIGIVRVAEERWSTQQDLRDADAVVELSADGLFDANDDLGPKVRFWVVEASLTPTRLTIGTNQFRGAVSISGFYGYQSDENEDEALLAAGIAIMDGITRRGVEFAELGVGMGDGYLGFLTEGPAMEGPPRAAELKGTGVQGYVLRITAAYFTELAA